MLIVSFTILHLSHPLQLNGNDGQKPPKADKISTFGGFFLVCGIILALKFSILYFLACGALFQFFKSVHHFLVFVRI